MPLVDMRELEKRAADLVVAELGAARWKLRDTGKLGIQMRDYDVIFADGHCEPLEVTTDADRSVLNTMARMEGNHRIAYSGERVWAVSVPNTSTDAAGKKTAFDLQACVALLVPMIERLESGGYERFDTAMLAWDFGSPYQKKAHGLLALGVNFGFSYKPSDPEDEPAILLAVGGGGAFGSNSITTEIERVAANEGNQAKLAACPGAPRRHLFVFITGASEEIVSPALSRVLDGTMEPPRIPELPEEITTVWASTRERGIYVTPPGDWQTFGAAPDAS
jgi:hypothetical protein